MRVLVADDSRIELARVRQIITQAGHDVVCEVRDGLSAVNALDSGMAVDLCILDVVMPYMTGDAAALAIAAAHPHVKIIFATKNSQTALLEIAVRIGARLIIKPYREDSLMTALEAF